MINIVRFSIQKSIFAGNSVFFNKMNTDGGGLNQKSTGFGRRELLGKSDPVG